MYIHLLPFYNICLLTSFHIKIFVCANKAENIFHSFLYTLFLWVGLSMFMIMRYISTYYACNMLEKKNSTKKYVHICCLTTQTFVCNLFNKKSFFQLFFFSYLFFPEKLMFSHMGSFLKCTGIPQTETTLAINNMSLFCS